MASAGQMDSRHPESGFSAQGHGMTWARSWNDLGKVMEWPGRGHGMAWAR